MMIDDNSVQLCSGTMYIKKLLSQFLHLLSVMFLTSMNLTLAELVMTMVFTIYHY